MRKAMAVAALGMLLGGCVNTMSYQEPASGPRAKVRFATDTEHGVVLRQYSDDKCQLNESEMMRLRNGALAGSPPKRLGIPDWKHHENAAKEVYIPAGRPFYALVEGAEQRGLSWRKCGVSFSFVFDEGGEYEVDFSHRDCALTITRFDRAASGAVRRVVERPGPMDRESCEKAFKKTRLY